MVLVSIDITGQFRVNILLFTEGPASIACATCNQVFSNSWNLILHCEQDHGLVINYTEKQVYI